MDIPPQNILEELIQRELSKLPEREAPLSLIPRVLAQIQARQFKRWWQCPWTQWPLGLQLASMPVMLASVMGAGFAASVVWRFLVLRDTLEGLSDQMDSLAPIWDVLAALGNALLILARAIGQEWLLLGLLVPVTMYAA